MSRMDIHESARKWGTAQYGLVTIGQLKADGATRDAIKALVRSGEFVRCTPRLLRSAAVTPSKLQRAKAAILDAGHGAALSHRSAAAWWGMPGFRFEPIELSRTRDRAGTPARLATVHEHLVLPEYHVTEVDLVRVTKPARCFFELCYLATRHQLHPEKALRAGDTFWAKGLADHRSFTRMLDELATKGRSGITLYRVFMADRPADYIPPASNLERRFNSLAEKAGGRPLRRQVNLGDAEEWIGRVDFFDSDAKLVVEVYSLRYHGARLDEINDEARTANLRAAGFTVIWFWDFEIWHNPQKVIRDLRIARSGG